MISHSPEKCQEVYRIASNLYQQSPDWVTFFREVLGIDGVVRQTFPTVESLASFEQTAEYRDIQQMLGKLRERSGSAGEDKEPIRVITVRMPKCLHETLRTEAHQRHTSMNKLCITKLLRVLGDELVAAQQEVA